MRFGQFIGTGILAALVFFTAGQSRSYAAGQWNAPQPLSAYSVPNSALLQPEQLNRFLHSSPAPKLFLFQVGSRLLFDESHIPGSEYIGPGALPEGAERLRARVARLPHHALIVLYCGCCPWSRCPNVGPAYKLLTGLGFTNVKVLYLPNNFGADWAAKGFPVTSGQ